MPTTSMLKFKGLHITNNYYSECPEGSLQVANNVNIDKLSTVESRRGLTQYGTIGSSNSDIAKQLLLYKDRVLVHFQNYLAYDNGSGTFANFSGSFSETESGLRLKSIEQNGNLFLTTSSGIRKIATNSAANLPTASVSNSGGIKAIGGVAEVDYTSEGFFEGYSKVAYSIVWGTKDINGNLILGTPSPAIEATNQSPNSGTINITFNVPNGITTDYFYRIYRTAVFTATSFLDIQNIVVNAEYNLVYEDSYVSGTQVTVNDIVPEDFREGGVPLYTNEASGEGILQANEPPPFAKDIDAYKNSLFFANTRTIHRKLIDMLGVSGLSRFGAVGDLIDISSISYSAPNTTINFSANHGLTTGDKVVITNSGAATLDGVQVIASSTANSITVLADGTGATATNASVYGSYITVTKGVNSDDYYFVGRPEINDISFAAYSGAYDYSYFIIYSADDKVKYVVYFVKSGDPDVPPDNAETVGAILIKVEILNTDNGTDIATKVKTAVEANSYDFIVTTSTNTATFTTSNSGTSTNPDITTLVSVPGISTTNVQNGDSESYANHYVRLSSLASPSQQIDDTARSLCNVITAESTGDVNAYYISAPNDVPGKMVFESRVLDTTAFTIVANNSDTGELFNPDITSAVSSENEEKPNRIYYSKTNQPEAVPLLNYFDVGSRDKKILRIVALRDSLFILKEDGIYRLSGENSNNFTITLFDNSANLLAPDTCAVLNNQIFCLSTQGVLRISEAGVDVISQPIKTTLDGVMAPKYLYTKTASFACSYIQDDSYIMWIPKDPTDAIGTIAYRFNTATETWTSWTKTGHAQCAIVELSANKLYVGPVDDNLIEVERKNLDRSDFADREYTVSIGSNAIVGNTIQLNSVSNIEVGDALIQSQYVSASVLTRLSRKLALDPGVPNTVGNSNKDFYRNISISPGDNLQSVLSSIITQLNSDIGTAYSTLFSVDIVTFKNEFNALMNSFNTSLILMHNNYLLANSLVEFEVSVVDRDMGENTITVETMQPLAVGNIKHYKAIDCEVVCSPYFFGEPATLKHVRDATIMFFSANLTRGTVGYNTDVSAAFEDIEFGMEGIGNWGSWVYDSIAWGGEGTARPFRTLIPRQKQRCRFIRTRFKHRSAFDTIAILGISYSFEVSSERAYR